MTIDSSSNGDPATFQTLDALVAGLDAPPAVPVDLGSVALLVIRGDGGRRQTPDRVRLTPDGGVEGDAWGRYRHRGTDDQIAVMQANVATLVANGQPLELFGDALFLHLDLSTDNLPLGSRVRVGTALLEVTPMPHNGCGKFRRRFGQDALRFVSDAERRHRNLRGVYMRVVEGGEASPGDVVQVVVRPPAAR